jgi:hypothetical protein
LHGIPAAEEGPLAMSLLPSSPGSLVASPLSSIGVPDPTSLLFLVVSLLRELRAPVDILECTLLPAAHRYAIRLHGPRETSQAVLLPRRPLERALGDQVARTRVRNLLRSVLEVFRGRPVAGKDGHLSAYFTALDVRSLPGPRCAYCEAPLLDEDTVVIRDGSSWHLACPPAW